MFYKWWLCFDLKIHYVVAAQLFRSTLHTYKAAMRSNIFVLFAHIVIFWVYIYIHDSECLEHWFCLKIMVIIWFRDDEDFNILLYYIFASLCAFRLKNIKAKKNQKDFISGALDILKVLLYRMWLLYLLLNFLYLCYYEVKFFKV